jgi:hypothetical protein
LLSQAKALHGFSDLDHQARFDLELIGIGQAQVGKHIARTLLHLDALHDARFHFRNSLTNAWAIFSLAWMARALQ